MAGMTHPDYAAMTVEALTIAVARLLLRCGAGAKAGKGGFSPFQLATPTGECRGPSQVPGYGRHSKPLLTAMADACQAVAGDTPVQTECRAFLSHLMGYDAATDTFSMHNMVIMWGSDKVLMLQEPFYTQARTYAGMKHAA